MISENITKNISQQLSDDNISFFIEEMLGDSHVSFEYIFFLSIIYSIFLIVGVFGNLSTCIVILGNEYMRTATNIYLLNLAIADLATLLISKNCGWREGAFLSALDCFWGNTFFAQNRLYGNTFTGLNLWLHCSK